MKPINARVTIRPINALEVFFKLGFMRRFYELVEQFKHICKADLYTFSHFLLILSSVYFLNLVFNSVQKPFS